MKKDTDLMLSEVRGLLNNLNDNLSGEHGAYWLSALKKMLRKEEIPQPPKKVVEMLESFNVRKSANERLAILIEYLETFPAVCKVERCEEEDDDLINICVYPRLNMFLLGNKNTTLDTALFSLASDGTIREIGSMNGQDIDEIFDTWKINDWSLKGFIDALIELGKKYDEAVPKIPQ